MGIDKVAFTGSTEVLSSGSDEQLLAFVSKWHSDQHVQSIKAGSVIRGCCSPVMRATHLNCIPCHYCSWWWWGLDFISHTGTCLCWQEYTNTSLCKDCVSAIFLPRFLLHLLLCQQTNSADETSHSSPNVGLMFRWDRAIFHMNVRYTSQVCVMFGFDLCLWSFRQTFRFRVQFKWFVVHDLKSMCIVKQCRIWTQSWRKSWFPQDCEEKKCVWGLTWMQPIRESFPFHLTHCFLNSGTQPSVNLLSNQ